MPSLQYINTMNQIQLLVSLYHEIENKSLFLNIVTRFFFFYKKAIPFVRSANQYSHIDV